MTDSVIQIFRHPLQNLKATLLSTRHIQLSTAHRRRHLQEQWIQEILHPEDRPYHPTNLHNRLHHSLASYCLEMQPPTDTSRPKRQNHLQYPSINESSNYGVRTTILTPQQSTTLYPSQVSALVQVRPNSRKPLLLPQHRQPPPETLLRLQIITYLHLRGPAILRQRLLVMEELSMIVHQPAGKCGLPHVKMEKRILVKRLLIGT